MKKQTLFNFYITEEFRSRVTFAAAFRGVTRSAYVRRATEEAMRRDEQALMKAVSPKLQEKK